jgi:hypothetical protein
MLAAGAGMPAVRAVIAVEHAAEPAADMQVVVRAALAVAAVTAAALVAAMPVAAVATAAVVIGNSCGFPRKGPFASADGLFPCSQVFLMALKLRTVPAKCRPI